MKSKQQDLLNSFFKKEDIWYPEYYAFGAVAGILLGISMLVYIFPVQIWEGDYQVLLTMLFMELMGVEMYLRRYSQFSEDGKIKSIRGLMRCLPVSHRQLTLFRLGKLMKLCLWMTGIAAACQTVFALAFMHTLSIGNVLMPLACCLALPLAVFGGGMAAAHICAGRV